MFVSNPVAWLRYLWVRELRQREVRFNVNPRFLDWRTSYRVARAPLAMVVGRPAAELDRFFAELGPLQTRLREECGDLPSAGALMQAPLLYVLLRASRPTLLVETGISSGFSARLMLEALARNGSGTLHSIGIDLFALRTPDEPDRAGLGGRPVGYLVPAALKDRWELHLGRSEEILPGLLSSLGQVDLFLHDSLHQYPTMMAEYSAAWPHLRPSGFLLSHDIHANGAWSEFLATHGQPLSAELDHDLGVARRSAAG